MSNEFRILRDRQVDFLIGGLASPFNADDLHAEPLYVDSMFILAARDGKWAARKKLRLADLIDEPWILAPDSIFNSIMMEAFQALCERSPKTVMRTYTVHQRLKLIASGRFIGGESGQIIMFNAKEFALVKLPIELPPRGWQVGVVTLRNRTLSPAAENFLCVARDVAKVLLP